jgi:hypothetical protein
MARQGKCARCKVRYEWSREIPLRRLRCTKCGGPIQATSYQWSGKTIQGEPAGGRIVRDSTGRIVGRIVPT